jgi:hypothetical protein
MNTKTSWLLLGIILIAILFVPLIPSDTPIECTGALDNCDEGAGYISVYTKFFH